MENTKLVYDFHKSMKNPASIHAAVVADDLQISNDNNNNNNNNNNNENDNENKNSPLGICEYTGQIADLRFLCYEDYNIIDNYNQNDGKNKGK